MNDSERDSEQSVEQVAYDQLQKDKAAHQAGEDLEDWKALEQTPAFHRCFLRRIREKRLQREYELSEGVSDWLAYKERVAEIKMLLEIEKMLVQEKRICFEHLNPRSKSGD